jgi:hypothetical protein
MKSTALILAILIITGCNEKKQRQDNFFLLNISFENFDKSLFKVWMNDKLILTDSVENHFISTFPWNEHKVIFPKDDFKLRIVAISNGYEIERDTIISPSSDSLKVFVTFNFSPFYKRYRNPDIYKYMPKETARLKEIADSLYANNVLPNASEYLNDTIPLRKSIEILIK